jgi:hypothetical protein
MTDLLTLFDIDNPPLPIQRSKTLKMTPTQLTRFMSKVYVDYGMPDGCWIWTACKNQNNYGHVTINNKLYKSHRVAYEIFNGCITDNLLVCHTCDNPSCVNPAHLFLGTNSQNVQDSVNKNRHANYKKTHCPSGHEYDATNTYIGPDGYRRCKICNKYRGCLP